MEISELQKDLAAAFRWTAKLNMHEGIANHFSVCMPGSNDFYINGSGMVDVNGVGIAVSSPFGGYKHSGIGREAGTEGLIEFLEVKTVGGWN